MGSPERQRKVSGQGSPERRRKISRSPESTRQVQGSADLGTQLEQAIGRTELGRQLEQAIERKVSGQEIRSPEHLRDDPGQVPASPEHRRHPGEAGEGRTRTAEELYMDLPEELRQLVDAAKMVKEEERKRESEERRREREEERRAEEQERMVQQDRIEREEEEVVTVKVVHCGRPEEEGGGVGGRSAEERGGVGGRSVVGPIVSGLLPTLAHGGAKKAPMSPGTRRRSVRQSRSVPLPLLLPFCAFHLLLILHFFHLNPSPPI